MCIRDSSYSLLLAEKATPFDLSVLNQLKLQIHASAPTQVLLKLEGAGPAVEMCIRDRSYPFMRTKMSIYG